MKPLRRPITDDHIHIDPWNGRGLEAAKDFRRAGGTHMMLVTKPSWSCGIIPSSGRDFGEVFGRTLSVAAQVEAIGIRVYPVLGVHPAEITRLQQAMTLDAAKQVMMDALDLAARHVEEGEAVALKSGRPHYQVEKEVLDASNEVLRHALVLSGELGCALQIHAESGACEDIAAMAKMAGIPVTRVVKHFAIPETPLVPSLIARHEEIPLLCSAGVQFMMESDYMDENSRPGAVMGPKSVPRNTLQLLAKGVMTEEDAYRIHVKTPARVYGVEIGL
ncbi:MAG: TatD family hydrolase [Methanomicrobiales archaeon]|nr:TatD family hydrolase [Methanomicrobiales archaeon]